MRRALEGTIFLVIAGGISAGCEEHHYHHPHPPPPEAVVVEPAYGSPVVQGPGVEVIQVEPPPAQRVYVYDPGYPPGTYFYNNYYWYGGYRYPHDVFVHRYVDVNVHEHRYVNVEDNRRMGHSIEVQHRQDYKVYRGHPQPGPHGPPPPPGHGEHDHDHEHP